jgi:membrane-associated phospholipid phosphatase
VADRSEQRSRRTEPRYGIGVWWIAVAPAAVALLVFGLLAYRIGEHRSPSWDSRLLQFLSPQGQRAPVRSALDLLNHVVGYYRGLVVAGFLFAALLAFGRTRAALAFGLLLGASLATVNVLKPAFHRPALIDDREGYFPSSHAAGAMVVGIALVRLAWPTCWRWPVLFVSLALVVGYGGALVYSRSHYPSDVLAGWCVAVFWACGLALLGYMADRLSSHSGL